MKKAFLFWSIIFLVIANNCFATTYRTTKDKQVTTSNYKVKSETTGIPDESRVILTNEDGYSVLTFGNQGLKNWHYRNEKNNSEFIAVRNGSVININGTFKGKVISDEFNIKANYWYQAMDYAVTDFVKSGQASREFWALSEEELKPRQFVFKRGNIVTIEIDGRKYETIRVRFTISGSMAVFWGSDYWVRKSDGLLVKFQGLKGPPGTPQIITELIDE